MLSILAPSKTLNFEQNAPEWIRAQYPLFQDEASLIVKSLNDRSVEDLMALMSVSRDIAIENHRRFQQWGDQRKPALWAYRGDVYKGMYADTLTERDVAWADDHIRIMSGLYGILRPRDVISPYRLEMKAKVDVSDRRNLYEFWGQKLAKVADEASDGIICNLSSDEYAKPITKYTKSRVVTPIFMDHKPNGAVGAVPIYSKMMRGVMARWIIDHRIDNPHDLKPFDRFEYYYDETKSSTDAPVFVHKKMTPLVF
jgi:cytoplasmic iron level regulating protein YaaA (DUF328/UPF0246 family)